ncbi:permease for cytosine/purines, uracil, thiamine, allantoin-domain-containing protein [Pseudomassariella vexata]|uniref:Permease for cytosine/purines, uracil, thiamine, allantoin-domain-containing protein n=1 Tax=Pseudomassariella vexata TaxID=1141098 RepID=A0A1Y2DLT5_9PEZI|nr:permease for cytosine/purines, uracil, thiamine, allantoin-domain-containing protein [Pseudomassariella vexata]ORY60268.1 permease for cytosine/purines, uracil, thiamine, allantoin-domain-containing protein [Pseudomassariella vexata]
MDPSIDIEKSAAGAADEAGSASSQASKDKTSAESNSNTATPPAPDLAPIPIPSKLRQLNQVLESLAGFESRGISRVPPSARQPPSRTADLQVAVLWFSANISCNNLIVGLYGPLLFQLGFLDSALCAVFGALLGSLSTSYMSIWGPQSGNRTMVVLRYFFGYWPAKVPTFLNVVLMVGYCTIDGIIGGQILSAVSGGTMSIAVGIVVVNLVCWGIVLFGMKPFHQYEKFAWIPQILALFVMVGCAGPSFDAKSISVGDKATVAANRLSFLSMCLYVPNSWAAAASDFYVYYPEKTSPVKIFFLTLSGLWTSFSLVFLLGIGLGTGLTTNSLWSEAFEISTGALLVAAYEPLHDFGRFCSVIVALGLIANSAPGTYSATLSCQVLGRYGQAVPRWVWGCVIILIELVLGLAGRNDLYVIFSNFLALMGYWAEFMVIIVIMERGIFRRNVQYDWAKWQDKAYMPIGIAALVSFLLGWLGAVLGMYQTWFVGPLAAAANVSDVGVWIGCAFVLVSFPPLRYCELRKFGR